jgi:hypothetical protein
MQTYRSSILPLFAILLSITAISYTSCHDTVAETKPGGSAAELKQQITRFEQTLTGLKLINDGHVKDYSEEMGCTSNSKALDIIKHHNELIEALNKRLGYHKLQLIQADTTNQERNKVELDELQKDFKTLETDAQEIRTGLVDYPPVHVTK